MIAQAKLSEPNKSSKIITLSSIKETQTTPPLRFSHTLTKTNSLLPPSRINPKVVLFRNIQTNCPYPLFKPSSCMKPSSVIDRIYTEKRRLLTQCNVRPSPENMGPQFGLTNVLAIKLYGTMKDQLTDVALRRVESLVALYFALSECVSKKQFLAILTLSLQTLTTKSLIGGFLSFATSLFDDYRPESGGTTVETDPRPEWLTFMSKGLTDWKTMVNNPAFAKISRLLSMFVTLGVLDDTMNVTIGNLTLFSIAAQEKHINAVDLMDACMDTVVFFGEGAYQCFLQGSMRPLLFSSGHMADIEKQCLQMNTMAELAKNGNLMKFMEVEDHVFDLKLSSLVDKLEYLYKTTPPGAERTVLCQRWRELSRVRDDYMQTRLTGGMRISPYCFKISGESSVGKTTAIDLGITVALKACKVPSF